MEITVYQRIKAYIDDNHISLNALAKTLNMNQSTLSSILVENFLKAYPKVSAEWLMRGLGAMYSNQDADDYSCMVAETSHCEEPKIEESHHDDSVLKAKYEELEKRYDQLLSILGGGMRQANVGN